jgi:hypothetical protein
MSLFSDLPPDQGSETITEAVQRLQEKLSRLPSLEEHSLCELCPDELDYNWLCRWAEHLSWPAAEEGGWKTGALTLFLAAELARRDAQEGHIWPVMQKRFKEQVHGRFFAAIGQPTVRLKGLLEEGAKQLKLRHVFGREGTQEWYVSIYLQFGFTCKGMASSLPEWLAGQRLTQAILQLRDPEKGSKGFRQLWSTLRNYRRDFLTEEQVRHVIRSSPWLLPSWEEDLLRLAREKLSLGTDSDDGPPESEVCPFLLPPRLCWEPPEEPAFSCELTNSDKLGLTAGHYHLQMGSSVLATLFRQPNKSYLPDQPEVWLPCTLPQVAVSLVDRDGHIAATQMVELWDGQEDINLFDAVTGRRISDSAQERLNPDRGYVLHTAADLLIHPPQPVWCRLGGAGQRTVTLLSPGWAQELDLRTANGSPLWFPEISHRPKPPSPDWAAKVKVFWKAGSPTIYVGRTMWPMVHGLGAGVTLNYVRLAGKPLLFDQEGHLGKVTITPELALNGLHFLLGLEYGNQQVQVRRTLDVEILGAAECTERGWEPVQTDQPLTVHEASAHVYRLFVPASVREQKVALMEGPLYCSSVGKRPQPLGKLGGIGAPLVVRRAPYNDSVDIYRLADAVIDHGIVRYVECPGGDQAYQVSLSRPIFPGPEHRVVFWSFRRGIGMVESNRIEIIDEGRIWRIPWAARDSAEPAVVAVAYQGSWRGSGWTCALDQLLPDAGRNAADPAETATLLPLYLAAVMGEATGSPVDARQTAGLLRWCHFPLLLCSWELGHRPLFEPFVRRHVADFLAVWLFDKGLEGLGLNFDDDADHYRANWAALRALFEGWQPSSDELEAIILELFAKEKPAEPLLVLTRRLLPQDPLLAGKLVLPWLKTHGPPPSVQTTAADYLRMLRRMAAGLPSNALDAQVYQRQDEVLMQAAQTMGVDSNFAYATAERAVNVLQTSTLKEMDAINLAVALQVGSFRHYLGLRVLEKVASLL